MKGTQRMADRIKDYLDRLAERDDYFALSYENPAKSIEECVDYICTQVRNMKVEGLDDDDVYGMAIHYYQEENPGDISKGINARVVVNHTVELTEEEKAEARQRAIDELAAAEKKKIQDKEKREKEAAKAKAEEARKKNEQEGVLSLF